VKKEPHMNIEYSLPDRCDICKSDNAERYIPANDKGYTGLCKDCFNIFYKDNIHLFENWFKKDNPSSRTIKEPWTD
jgi:hypothetical protein